MDDSVIICGEVIDADTESNDKTNFNEKKATCKRPNFNILLAFFLITIALLIAISTYYYLIKYRRKQKHFLPLQFTNNKIKI